jgi:nitrite reductase (NADH) small subunit
MAQLYKFHLGKTFEIGELKMAVFRTLDGRFFSTQVFCPHKGALLADGIVGGGNVIYPFHVSRFDLDAAKPVGNDCETLQSYRVERSKDGNLQLHHTCVMEFVPGHFSFR